MKIKVFAVFGNPIKHSLSPIIHRQFAKECNISLEYRVIESPIEEFESKVYNFFIAGGSGANITIPFKQRANVMAQTNMEQSSSSINKIFGTNSDYYHKKQINIIEKTRYHAIQSGAANTLSLKTPLNPNIQNISDNNKDIVHINAFNTDGIGLITDIQKNNNWQLNGKNALILGAGGAVRAIIPALAKSGIQSITITNRTHKHAVELVDHFSKSSINIPLQTIGLNQLRDYKSQYGVIINGTSLGVNPKRLNKKINDIFFQYLPSSIIHKNILCYDLVYSNFKHIQTSFIQWARELGAENLSDGLGMLVEQAKLSFQIWNGLDKKPNSNQVISQVKQSLSA